MDDIDGNWWESSLKNYSDPFYLAYLEYDQESKLLEVEGKDSYFG